MIKVISQMKYSHKLSDAIHILVYIYIYQNDDLSSRAIAGSIESNPSLVRQLMTKLSNAGLLSSQPGKVKPKLNHPIDKITIDDVYHAIEQPKLLHIDDKTNPKCIVGAHIQNTLNHVYDEIQMAAEHKMQTITIQDIAQDILKQHYHKNDYN